jgi:hypothetical protein
MIQSWGRGQRKCVIWEIILRDSLGDILHSAFAIPPFNRERPTDSRV